MDSPHQNPPIINREIPRYNQENRWISSIVGQTEEYNIYIVLFGQFWVWAVHINIRGITLGLRLVLHYHSYIKLKITAAVEYC